MDLSLNCIVSLSKKVRTLIADGNATIILKIDNIKNGRGDGRLFISSDDKLIMPEDLLKHETSIMITPIDVKEEVPGQGEVGNIFTSNSNKLKTGNRTAVDRLAAIEAPSTKQEVAHAIKTEKEIGIPEGLQPAVNPVDRPRFQSYVKNLQELMNAVAASRNKVSSIDIDSIDDSTNAGKRQKAAAIELKEMEESIDEAAFIVNTKFASLVINDIGIQLGLNMPFDLSKVSARRIASSRELRNLISDGTISIISPEQAVEMRKNYQVQEIPGALKAYGVDEAADRMFEGGVASQATELRLYANDLNEVTEEQQLASLVRSQLPVRDVQASGTVLSGGVRRTAHRASFGDDNVSDTSLSDLVTGLPHIEKRVPGQAKTNSAGIKTIARR